MSSIQPPFSIFSLDELQEDNTKDQSRNQTSTSIEKERKGLPVESKGCGKASYTGTHYQNLSIPVHLPNFVPGKKKQKGLERSSVGSTSSID